jgi:hypothetical protein
LTTKKALPLLSTFSIENGHLKIRLDHFQRLNVSVLEGSVLKKFLQSEILEIQIN